MRYILIDPVNKTVTEHEHPNEPKLEEVDDFIGHGCSMLQLVPTHKSLGLRDGMYVDDEGIQNQQPGTFFFTDHQLIGRGVILGHTTDGDWCSASTKLEELRNRVRFL